MQLVDSSSQAVPARLPLRGCCYGPAVIVTAPTIVGGDWDATFGAVDEDFDTHIVQRLWVLVVTEYS